jgi:hypothetical protein
MDGPNFEIEHHDQVLKRLGRKPLEPSPRVTCLLQRIIYGGASLLNNLAGREGARHNVEFNITPT